MARRPAPRLEYGTEIMALAKIARAVSLDTSRAPEWREKLVKLLNAAQELLQADQARVAGGGDGE
jgi:hypothetical protein